jgi:hypothetical protein
MPCEEWGYLLGAWRERERRKLEGAAMICSLIANTHRDEKKKREPFTPADFLPPDPAESGKPKETDWAAVQARMQAFVDAQNGTR